jgi:hypothetical protein
MQIIKERILIDFISELLIEHIMIINDYKLIDRCTYIMNIRMKY